ncbi:alanine racemase [Aplysia californica]|uniref:Alanine racemase n=1 Tax=Aplysia californica TaxID=6500 RepID=A0ABM1VR76_APLCA|nr:alanine racemase [Aplysia californica]
MLGHAKCSLLRRLFRMPSELKQLSQHIPAAAGVPVRGMQQNVHSKRKPFHLEEPKIRSEFDLAGRSTYLRVNVEAIWHNIKTLKSRCSDHTEVIAVVKGNAYGHGSVGVCKYLRKCGIRHFAVATALEGRELREHGMDGLIQVFGNCMPEDINGMLAYGLTPTSTSIGFLNEWAFRSGLARSSGIPLCVGENDFHPQVIVKVDSGMSRNGCQIEELPALMEACDSQDIPVHSIMTHFAQSWDDPEFTQGQLDKFLKAAAPFRSRGIKVHAANSAAIIKGYGTDLDYVRPGISMYGLAPDGTKETASAMQSLGFKPAVSWIARPVDIKLLQPGRAVGYDQTHRVKKPEWIATFSFGYADGYNRLLSGSGCLTDEQGNAFPVVGRVSMDAITAKVDENVTQDTVFHVIRNDYTSPNSASNMADTLRTIPYEIGTSLAARLPRLFVTSDDDFSQEKPDVYY